MGLKIVCHLSNRHPCAQDKFPSIEKAYRSVNTHTQKQTHTHTHTHTHTAVTRNRHDIQMMETDGKI